MNKQFNKHLILTEEKQQQFQSNSSCWICEKPIDDDNENVTDECDITSKFRGAAHWSCNINFQLAKKFPVIFHNLRGYDSHLIFDEINKSDVKIDVIPNWIRKIDSIQFSLEKLVKNLSENDFKQLTEEFG